MMLMMVIFTGNNNADDGDGDENLWQNKRGVANTLGGGRVQVDSSTFYLQVTFPYGRASFTD